MGIDVQGKLLALQSQMEQIALDVERFGAGNPDNLPPVPVEGGGGLTTDYMFDSITHVDIPTRTSNFLKITKGNPATASWVEAMPGTQDEDSVVLDVTKNRIYFHGIFGG